MSEFERFPKIARLNRDIVITEKIDGTNACVMIEQLAGDPACVGGVLPCSCMKRPDILDYAVVDGRVFGVRAGKRTSWLNPADGKNWDNHGFGAWVLLNAAELVAFLGPGRHFGEWWGAGVQRRYGVPNKRFSLFNVARYGAADAVADPRCAVTPKEWAKLEATGMAWELFPNGPEGAIRHKFHEGKKVCACRPAQADVRATIGGVLVEPVPVLYRGPWFGTLYINSTGGDYAHNGFAPALALQKLETEGSVAAPGFMDPEGIVVFHEASGQLFKATVEGDEKPKGENR